MRTPILIAALSLLACGPTAPPASQTLPRLRAALEAPVPSEQKNRENSALVQEIVDNGHVLGLTRLEVEEKLGKGDECRNHELCAEHGFYDTDLYYEVGQTGDIYLRFRPALILGFDRFGKVTRTYNLRVE